MGRKAVKGPAEVVLNPVVVVKMGNDNFTWSFKNGIVPAVEASPLVQPLII